MRFFQSRLETVPPAAPVTDSNEKQLTDEEKTARKSDNDAKAGVPPHADGHETGTDADSIDQDAQAGVRKIEATTMVWSKKHLIGAYVIIWIIYFIDALQQGTGFAMTPYITSEFQMHSLTAATQIFSSLIGGLTKLPLAKVLDIWGRPQGFILMMSCMMIGLIMMAACPNVETYAAAQVFYWVGYNGISYTLSVFIADTSALKNRGLMLAFISSPYIITVWIVGPFAESFLFGGPGFRWAFGVFVIVTPVICAPLIFLFLWNQHKAKKAGLIPARNSGRTMGQSIMFYLREFDVVGLILIIAGFSFMLLALSTYSYHGDKWRSPTIYLLLTFGGLLLVAFVLWERYLAPVKFFPFHLLFDRTVFGACLVSATFFVSWYIWNAYFSSFLQVAMNLTLTQTTYIGNIYSIGACAWSFVVGLAIRYTGRFKWIAVFFGVPVTILGVGLMIHFRQPDTYIGYIAMCQVFIALAGGAIVITEQVAAMAAVSHQYIATVLAIEGMFTSVGGAIGQTIAAALWTGIFPFRLEEYLPQEQKVNATMIYSDIKEQLKLPWGTPGRDAVNHAYGDAQRIMLIAATCVHILSIVAVLMWRDIKVKDFKQVKGTVV